MTGTLVLVATPIGNLGDLAPRAVEVLRRAALVCCEDTRRTGRLLAHAGVEGARLRRVDDHTEAAAAAEVIACLAAGDDVALVSDAGTPGVSDPGERLVAAVVAAGHAVSTVPGPSAAVAALVLSGFSTERFAFEGFLPRKGRRRAARVAAAATDDRTVVIYESAKRLGSTLADLAEAAGPQRRAVVVRELTKLHEEVVRGSLGELRDRFAVAPKGEIVVVVEGAPPAEAPGDDEVTTTLATAFAAGMTTRDAVDRVAADTGVARRRVYDLAVALRERDDDADG